MRLLLRWAVSTLGELQWRLLRTTLHRRSPPPLQFQAAGGEAVNRGAWHEAVASGGSGGGGGKCAAPNGLTALVVGGTRGIGREVCLGLAARGWAVHATGRDAAAGKRLEDDIRRAGGDATFLQLDLSGGGGGGGDGSSGEDVIPRLWHTQ